MAQVKYTVQVTNGSQAVKVPGMDVARYIKASMIFMVSPDHIPYTVAADAAWDGTDTNFTLTGAYQGATNLTAPGVIASGKTTGGINTLAQGDVGSATIFTQAMYAIQSLFDAAPAAAFAGKTTDALPEGTTNQYFSDLKVRLATLLGLTAQNSPVLPTDTVLDGIGKLQGQHSAHVGARGDVHGLSTQFEHGFMSNTDKLKLDQLSAPTVSAVAPQSPVQGSRWTNTATGITYTWIVNGSNNGAWVQVP